MRQDQRYSRSNLCPICSGHPSLPKGRGVRCWGYYSDDGGGAVCTREEFGGYENSSGGFFHRLNGNCVCGNIHGLYVPPLPKALPDDSNSEYLESVWNQGEGTQGTSVERYLQGRGITIPIPDSLRCHRNLKHTPTGKYYWAMLASVVKDGQLTGLQRTYLEGNSKANVDSNKMSIGRISGGAVRLGDSGKVLGLAEGVETALSVQQEMDIPVWAVLGAGNFPFVELPELPIAEEIHLFADGDFDSIEGVTKAADVFVSEGRSVEISTAPVGKDFNDVLMAQEVLL